jgi:hypothetical protein
MVACELQFSCSCTYLGRLSTKEDPSPLFSLLTLCLRHREFSFVCKTSNYSVVLMLLQFAVPKSRVVAERAKTLVCLPSFLVLLVLGSDPAATTRSHR